MRIFFDTEFMEDGKTIELLSIGMVAEDGRRFYAENAEADQRDANPWVKQNVLPYLGKKPGSLLTRSQIAIRIVDFAAVRGPPEFWAYYGAYDWVVLCQLFGRMIDLPQGWPMFCRDVKQLSDSLADPVLPKQDSGEHHALADALWTRTAWQFLTAEERKSHVFQS